MKRLLGPVYILFFAVLAIAVMSTFARAQVSDQEIADQHSFCNRPDHLVPAGSLNNRPPDVGHYKPEWKDCEKIDAEYEARDLARKTKAADEKAKLNNLLKRMQK